ncbi:hypothetical protein HDU97_001213 [Phlyctochytrium planicorne]|nr:hypothetical protein HDU97_001213 [Phlyctochytrium planicorne]
MAFLDLNYLLSLILWGYLPRMATDFLLKQIYTFAYPRGAPPPNHPLRRQHYSILFSVDPEVNAAAQANYMRIRDAYEVLKDPLLKNAYELIRKTDKYGRSIEDCQRCKTERDFVKNSINSFISFYIGTGFVLVIFSVLGKGDFGRYWRFVGLGIMASLEASVLWRANSRPFYFLPWRTTAENVEMLHHLFIALSIAGSQIGPVIFPAKQTDLKQIIEEMEQITMLNLGEATLQFRSTLEPFAKDPAGAGRVQRRMEKTAIDLKLMEIDPALRPRRGAPETE